MSKNNSDRSNLSILWDDIIENIIEENIGNISEEYQKIFGANKNLYRYIPSMIDGLKPVQRRLLYALYKRGVTPGHRKKLNQVNGFTVDFHPHGDAAIGDVAVNLAQTFANLNPYITGKGNFGSQKGSRHSASRYLEVCLTPFAIDCFFKEFNDCNVDMKLAYTGTTEEPVTLPSKYPVALMNGYLASIGYALSSNIPPYNFKELCETVITLIKDPKAKIKIKPDSPTGCDIVYSDDLDKIIDEHRPEGYKLKMRAGVDIDYVHNIITITSLPMQVTADSVVVPLAAMCKAKKIESIIDIKDQTQHNDIKIQIYVKADENPDNVLDVLMKSKLNLQKTFNMSITLIDEYRNYDYSVRSFILEWLEYRRDLVRSSYNTILVRKEEERHMNDVKIMVSDSKNGPMTNKMASESQDAPEFARKLIAYYGITSLQAKVISNMKSVEFTIGAHETYVQTKETLIKEIKEIEEILETPELIDNKIIQDMEEGIKKYGEPRRSKIIYDDGRVSDETSLIGLSEDGYIKKKLLDGGSIGNISKNPGQMNMAIAATGKDTLLIFDEEGYMHILPVSNIPDMTRNANGLLLSKFIKIEKGTRIVAVMVSPKGSEIKNMDNLVTFITKTGFMKKVPVPMMIKEGGIVKKRVLALEDTDRLVSAIYTPSPKYDIIVFTNLGDGIRLDLEDIPTQMCPSKGQKCLVVRKMEYACGAKLIMPDEKYLIYVTTSGKVKRTEMKYFPVMKRKDPSLPLINLDDNEKLVSIVGAKDDQSICIYRKLSDPVDIKIADIPLTTRIAKAEKMVKTPKGDSVIAVKVERG